MYSRPANFTGELPLIAANPGTYSEWLLPEIDEGTLSFDTIWLTPDIKIDQFVSLVVKDAINHRYAVVYNGDINVLNIYGSQQQQVLEIKVYLRNDFLQTSEFALEFKLSCTISPSDLDTVTKDFQNELIHISLPERRLGIETYDYEPYL